MRRATGDLGGVRPPWSEPFDDLFVRDGCRVRILSPFEVVLGERLSAGLGEFLDSEGEACRDVLSCIAE